MKKTLLIISAILIVALIYGAWVFFGPATAFEGKKESLDIRTGSTYNDVLATVEQEKLVSSLSRFKMVAKLLGYPSSVKTGHYDIKHGMSLVNIIRMLKNGQQAPVNLVITKIRTKENLAGLVGRKFECDSTSFINFLNNEDSLKQYGLDSNTVMVAVQPNTYTYYWNIQPSKIFEKLYNQYETFWTVQRKEQAIQKGLTPQTATILASIIEEETLKNDEKGNMASVYLNRLHKGMKLGADPTVKFALRDFGLKRIYNKHLTVESPYNTYRVTGLPPGPICTPSAATIDAVLQSPSTNYLYFVAKSDFSGYHTFSDNYDQHLKYAKEYQEALNKRMEEKAKKDSVAARAKESTE